MNEQKRNKQEITNYNRKSKFWNNEINLFQVQNEIKFVAIHMPKISNDLLAKGPNPPKHKERKE